jgi:hypothetical protein
LFDWISNLLESLKSVFVFLVRCALAFSIDPVNSLL